MREERGSALVQVLIMSVLLIILATGLMKVVFQNHTSIARVQRSDKYKATVDACMAQKTVEWATTTNGVCAAGTCNVNGYVVNVTCKANNAVDFQVTDASW